MAPSRRRAAVVGAALLISIVAGAAPSWATTSPPVGSWSWPIEGSVVRGFEPPPTPFSAGHRGIDIAASFGSSVRAPADGVVSFAGSVAGELFVTIDHGDGYRSTDSWLGQVLVKKGTTVKRGDVVAQSGRGDPKVTAENLMFSVRIGDTYIDPLTVLAPQSAVDLVRLAPLSPAQLAPSIGAGPDPRAGPVSSTWPWPVPRQSHRRSGVRWGSILASAGVRGPPWVS